MGQITVDFPDEYRDDLMTGLRAFLGEDAGGLSDEASARKAIKRFAKNEARKVARRNTASQQVADAQAALVEKEAAAAAAVKARLDAEAASDHAIEAAFGEDS